MADEFLTSGEFGRFRIDLTAWRAEIAKQIADGFTGVHSQLDDINGRGRRNSEQIAVLHTEVQNLTDHGCAQYEEHRKVLTDGVIPKLDQIEPTGCREWHPVAKGAAGVGGFAALATLMELFARILRHFGI